MISRGHRAIRSALLLATAALMTGCASRSHKTASTQPLFEDVALADLPPMTLPDPAAEPASATPMAALQLYAQGRDALLRNDKSKAAVYLSQAVNLDPSSAVAQRDLGYARLGVDNQQAAAAFRQAIAFDPLDADSRLQLSRLLIDEKKFDPALEQLRLARLSPDVDDDSGLAAVVDILLGRLLEQKQYRRAALDAYEHVLAILDSGSIDLRGRPELADLLAQPGALILRVADLSLLAGRSDRATQLYQRLQRQEPQAAYTLELRIAQAQIASGKVSEGTRRAFNFVETYRGSHASVVAFAQLFVGRGGDREALKQVDALPQTLGDPSMRHVLRSGLLSRMNDLSGAIQEIDHADRIDLPAVRQTVHAYRAAGRDEELIKNLIHKTTIDPQHWPAIARGWEMLTQSGQPRRISVKAVQAISVPLVDESAKAFVLAQLYVDQGQPVPAKALLARSVLNPQLAEALRGANEPLSPEQIVRDAGDLADTILDQSDDPALLASLLTKLSRNGQRAIALEALHAANTKSPGNVVVAGAYAQLLTTDEQRTEAIAALDHAAAIVTSADELYFLSSQYSDLGESSAAEQLLRRANAIDPHNAGVANDLGYLLADSGRDLDFAETLLRNAVGAEPQSPAYLDSLGWLLYKRSHFSDAARYLTEAVAASDPADPVVLNHAGDALWRDKQPNEARSAWSAAIDAIRQRGSSDPHLQLRVELKLRQVDAKESVDVAPLALK